MEPGSEARIDRVISRLLDEVLKDFLWQCRIQLNKAANPEIVFLPRQPELISLVNLPPNKKIIVVYPDPPLGAEESILFETLAPQVKLKSLTKWMAEEGL
jgi:hypothetical protein